MTLGLYAQALKSKRRRAHSQRARAGAEWAPAGTTPGTAPFDEAVAPTA